LAFSRIKLFGGQILATHSLTFNCGQ
jgi:hypothetical protein